MENSSNNPLKDFLAQHLLEKTQEIEELEAVAKDKRKSLSELMNINFGLIEKVETSQIKNPNDLSTPKHIIEENEKFIAKMLQQVNHEPPVFEFRALSLVEDGEKTYGVDEFTAQPYDELQAEINTLKEASQDLKQKVLEAANKMKKSEEKCQNFYKEIELEINDIKNAENILVESQKDLLGPNVLVPSIKPPPPSKENVNEIIQQLLDEISDSVNSK